jgi:hypothetical protein
VLPLGVILDRHVMTAPGQRNVGLRSAKILERCSGVIGDGQGGLIGFYRGVQGVGLVFPIATRPIAVDGGASPFGKDPPFFALPPPSPDWHPPPRHPQGRPTPSPDLLFRAEGRAANPLSVRAASQCKS